MEHREFMSPVSKFELNHRRYEVPDIVGGFEATGDQYEKRIIAVTIIHPMVAAFIDVDQPHALIDLTHIRESKQGIWRD